jgi:hypothetical protein
MCLQGLKSGLQAARVAKEEKMKKTMEKKTFWLGMLVLALVFGMTVVGCDDGSTNDNGGGTFVLTDIPATYNGKYAYFEVENANIYIVGCQSINMTTGTVTLVQISNGRVSIPLWIETDTGSISKYSGDDTFTQNDRGGVVILDTVTFAYEGDALASIYFPSIIFSNGNATKSANDGFIITN